MMNKNTEITIKNLGLRGCEIEFDSWNEERKVNIIVEPNTLKTYEWVNILTSKNFFQWIENALLKPFGETKYEFYKSFFEAIIRETRQFGVSEFSKLFRTTKLITELWQEESLGSESGWAEEWDMDFSEGVEREFCNSDFYDLIQNKEYTDVEWMVEFKKISTKLKNDKKELGIWCEVVEKMYDDKGIRKPVETLNKK